MQVLTLRACGVIHLQILSVWLSLSTIVTKSSQWMLTWIGYQWGSLCVHGLMTALIPIFRALVATV